MAEVGRRLRWRRTSPDRDDDFEARDGDDYCRIYRVKGGPQDGLWYWTAARTQCLGSGFTETAREAASMAERAYFARA